MDVEIKSLPANDNLSCKHDDAPSRRKRQFVLPRDEEMTGKKARQAPFPTRCWDNRPLFDYLAGIGNAPVLEVVFQDTDCRS